MLDGDGELYVVGNGDPESEHPGIVQATQSGYLKHLPGTGLDDIQFWRLTDEGCTAIGAVPRAAARCVV